MSSNNRADYASSERRLIPGLLPDEAKKRERLRQVGFVVLALTAIALLVGCGGGSDDTGEVAIAAETAASDPAVDFPVRFKLEPIDGSGVHGRVRLEPVSETMTQVTVVVDGEGTSGAAAIHGGTCGDLDRKAKIELGQVSAGRSARVIDRSLASLLGPDLVVAVTEGKQQGRYLACGAIPDTARARIDAG